MSDPCIQNERILRHGMEIDVLRDSIKENIKNMSKDLEDHVNSGKAWRISLAGVAVIMLIQIGTAVFFYGKLVSIVDNHEKSISRLENRVLR